jgi:hypothetical protein
VPSPISFYTESEEDEHLLHQNREQQGIGG